MRTHRYTPLALGLAALALTSSALASPGPDRETVRAVLGAATRDPGQTAAATTLQGEVAALHLEVRRRHADEAEAAIAGGPARRVARVDRGLFDRTSEFLVVGSPAALEDVIARLGPDRARRRSLPAELELKIRYSYGNAPSDFDWDGQGWFPPIGNQRYTVTRTEVLSPAEAFGLWTILEQDAPATVGEKIRQGEWTGHHGGYLEDLLWSIDLPGRDDPFALRTASGSHRY